MDLTDLTLGCIKLGKIVTIEILPFHWYLWYDWHEWASSNDVNRVLLTVLCFKIHFTYTTKKGRENKAYRKSVLNK